MVGGAAALRVGAVALPKTTPLHAPGEECVRHDLIYRKTFCRKGKKKQLQMRSHHYLRREAISTNYRVRLSVCLLHFNILRNAYFLLGELVYLLSKIINGLFLNLILSTVFQILRAYIYIHIFFFFLFTSIGHYYHVEGIFIHICCVQPRSNGPDNAIQGQIFAPSTDVSICRCVENSRG